MQSEPKLAERILDRSLTTNTLWEWVMMYERFAECGLKPIFFLPFFYIHSHPFFFTGFGKMESRNKCGWEQIGSPGNGNSEMLFSTSIAALERSTSTGCRLEMGYMDWFAFSNYR